MNVNFMLKALEIAKNGLGFTSPNPCVGAVVVSAGKIIGQGWHKKAGGKHAEVIAFESALKKFKKLPKGAELYVTLEPCAHTGKTPPCTELILNSGIKKVYVGMRDPFDKVNGKGIKFLRKSGVSVELLNPKSELAFEMRSLNQPFIKWAKTGLPYITLKVGMSLDGKIASAAGESKWITSELARDDARTERSICDAVLVGAGTVKADDPTLAPHGIWKNKNLMRIIVDSKGTLGRGYKVFRDENVMVVSKVDLPLFKSLSRFGIQNIFVEGGSSTHGDFWDQKFVDRVVFYIAPKILGGAKSLTAIGGNGVKKLALAELLSEFRAETVGSDLKVSGFVNFY